MDFSFLEKELKYDPYTPTNTIDLSSLVERLLRYFWAFAVEKTYDETVSESGRITSEIGKVQEIG
mgnify:FL=1